MNDTKYPLKTKVTSREHAERFLCLRKKYPELSNAPSFLMDADTMQDHDEEYFIKHINSNWFYYLGEKVFAEDELEH